MIAFFCGVFVGCFIGVLGMGLIGAARIDRMKATVLELEREIARMDSRETRKLYDAVLGSVRSAP